MDQEMSELAALRAEYELGGLDESDLPADPMVLFGTWLDAARQAALSEPNAMVLATSAPTGPSARTVLLKGLDAGFVFFTNYESRKGADLAVQPACSLLFGWYPLQRQVRVEGVAEPVARPETEAYFASRPRDSQLGAWASRQSAEVGSREELDASYAAVEERFIGQEIPAPPFWGGYRVIPRSIEFWQGRRGRMHDRLVYVQTPEGWHFRRLAP